MALVHERLLEEARARLAEMRAADANVVIPSVPSPLISPPQPVLVNGNERVMTAAGTPSPSTPSMPSAVARQAARTGMDPESPSIMFSSSEEEGDDTSCSPASSSTASSSSSRGSPRGSPSEHSNSEHSYLDEDESDEGTRTRDNATTNTFEDLDYLPQPPDALDQHHPIPRRPSEPMHTASGLASPLRRRKPTPPAEVWIFGYGSLVWKCDYPIVDTKWGYVLGFRRRLWQGSPDHRGTPRRPGRVFTLLPTSTVRDLEASVRAPNGAPYAPADDCTNLSDEDRVYGKCFRLDPKHADRVLGEIDEREVAGFLKQMVVVHCLDGNVQPALVYSALPSNAHFMGPETEKVIAAHTWCSRGPSGPNSEYVLRTHDALADAARDSNVTSVSSDSHCAPIHVDAHLAAVTAHLKVLRRSRPATRRDFIIGSRLYCRGRMVQICKPAEWPVVFYFFLDEHTPNVGDGMGAAKQRVVFHCNVIDDAWLPFSCPVKSNSAWSPPQEGDVLVASHGQEMGLEREKEREGEIDGGELQPQHGNRKCGRRNVLTLIPLMEKKE